MPGGPALQTEEVLLRRFAYEQYQVGDSHPGIHAFNPIKNDVEGISLSREQSMTAAELGALGSAGKQFWVERLSVAKAIAAGAVLVPDLVPEGHVTLVNLTYENRRTDGAKELKERLRRSCIEVAGPFMGTAQR